MDKVIEGIKGVIVIAGAIAAINSAAFILKAYDDAKPEQNVPMVDPNVPSHHADDIPPIGRDGL